MDVAEILAELEYIKQGTFPLQALESAVENRDSVIPALLSVLEKCIEDIENLIDQPDYMLHIYAMYLLAQFREQQAYPLLVQLFSIPGETVHDISGDVVTEDLGRILASVSCGDDSLIKSLIENRNLNEYVRSAAIRALVTLVACNEKSREELISYFHELFNGRIEKEYSLVWNELVSSSADLYPEELYQDIEQCYEDELVASLYISLDDVQDMLELGKDETLSQLRSKRSHMLVTDAISDMNWWSCFQPQKESRGIPNLTKKKLSSLLSKLAVEPSPRQTEPFRSRKIGRNEPCPCGSGKKYKKCCLWRDSGDAILSS
jgi:Protein of unknown function (DUF1186)/SEC-C motif